MSGVEKGQWRVVGLLTGAHLLHDMSLGTLGVLLPFLREKLGFSLLLAGLLVPGQQAGSLFQPALGFLADRVGKRRFVLVFLTGTSVCMSLVGLAPAYVVLFVTVMFGGFSSAAYHPAGSALLTDYAGKRWGTGLAIYHFGGNIGLAIGPLAAAYVVSEFALESTWLLMAPGVVWAGILAATLPRGHPRAQDPEPLRTAYDWVRSQARVFGRLGIVILVRAIGAGGLALFLPTLLLERGFGLASVAFITSSFFVVAGVGGLVTGWVSDRIDRRTVIAAMLLIAPFGLLLFLFQDGALSILGLLAAGVSLRGEQPVIMALIQEWAPERRGTVVGLVLGSQFVLGALGTSMVGWLADSFGLEQAFRLVALVPLAGVPFVRKLPLGPLGS